MENIKLVWIPIVFVVLSFVIEIIEKHVSFLNKSVAFYFFWIGISIGCFLIFLELFSLAYKFINTYFTTPSKKVKEYNQQIENEQKEIKELLDFNPDNNNIEVIRKHYNKMDDVEFSKQALAPYLIRWYNQIDAMHYFIFKDEKSEELEDFEDEKKELQKNIAKLKKEKQILQNSEDEQLLTEKEEFLKYNQDKIQIESTYLSSEQKHWLEDIGFKKSHQWCIHNKESTEFMIKPRHNESQSHAYLTGAIFEYLKNEVGEIETPITKTADIIFSSAETKFAIEIETGKVHEKSKKQLKKKVEILNKEFPNTWFFVVTNKNLVSKYKKFGEVVDRSNVIEYLERLLGIECQEE
jgi:hypothetical protein